VQKNSSVWNRAEHCKLMDMTHLET